MRRLGILVAAALFAFCGPPETRLADTPVFIISIDTLRSDRLSVYGDSGASTPAFDRFRRDAILFEHAFSHTPLTLPSHASILTGRLPTGHRVRDNAGYTLAGTTPSIQKVLKDSGYVTGAAVSSYVLRRQTGISAGFDFFDDSLAPGAEERAGEETRKALTTWLAAQNGRNIFGFLHLFEPHAPYEPAQPFAGARTPYDGEVSWVDSIVGSFLDDLRARGLYDDALIIILSDHGEGLGDHGEDEHGVFLYRESIQVPLLVKLPRNARAGDTVSRPVGLVDVVPAILEALRLPSIPDLDGSPLLAEKPPLRRIYSETFFPRLHLGWSESFSLLDDTHHYIDAPRSELYRYRTDRREEQNVLGEERRVTAAMRAELARIDRSLNPPGAVSREERESLAALGYIGSSAAAGGALPDAKDRVHALRSLKKAMETHKSRDYQQAAAMLGSVIKEAPELIDAWSLLAESQLQLGERTRAIETLRGAAARFPTHPDVRIRLAAVLLESGDLDAAEKVTREALSTNEGAAREMLARIALARGDLDRAERELNAAIEKDPSRRSLLLIAAQVAARRRDFVLALDRLQRFEAEGARLNAPPVRDLHLRKAEALLELGRVAEAETELRKEVQFFPDHLEAIGGLAAVLAGQGKTTESREVLRAALALNNNARARRMARDTLVAAGDAEGLRLLGLE